MGTARLTYSTRGDVPLAMLVADIEHGVTFRRYVDREDVVLPARSANRWVEAEPTQDGFRLHVDDEFLLPTGLMLQKLITVLLFNCQDYGVVRLEDVDLRDSALGRDLRPPEGDGWGAGPKFATVVKPYFHLDVHQRVGLLARWQEAGFDAVKEDECFIVPAEVSLAIARAARPVLEAGLRYVPNVNGFIHDYEAMRALAAAGVRTVLVNSVVVGLSSVVDLRRQVPELEVWTHRVGYEALADQLSVRAFTQLAVLAGSSVVHVGTPLSESEALAKRPFAPFAFRDKGWFRPVFSKLTPETLDVASGCFGRDGIYLTCGYLRDGRTGELDQRQIRAWTARIGEERRSTGRHAG